MFVGAVLVFFVFCCFFYLDFGHFGWVLSFVLFSVFETLCVLLFVVPGFSWLLAAFCLDLLVICLCSSCYLSLLAAFAFETLFLAVGLFKVCFC